ncbi:Gfo/Idh/MocA family oxidoreductase [bacterium]|nr:Gfo/Idh/MocA family oxidoreductase [bacterium]
MSHSSSGAIPKLRDKLDTPIRWGIIGCGMIATHAICPAIRWSPMTRLLGVSSRDADTAQRKMREAQAERSYGSYEELLADPEIQAVFIGTPNGTHEEWVIKAAKAGKHILCGKSLALNSAAAQRMVEASQEAGVLLMEAYMYRHHPQWDTVRALIKEGRIGEVRLIRAGLCGPLHNTHDHRWSSTLGGGGLYDVTCYAANVARMLYGREPINVSARADTSTPDKVDRTSVAILDFDYGRMALISGSLASFNNQYCEIEGTFGRISIEHPFIPGWERTAIYLQHGMNAETIEIPGANHFLHQIEHFSLCLSDPTRPMSPAEDGLLQILVNESIEQAWLSGKVVEVPEP